MLISSKPLIADRTDDLRIEDVMEKAVETAFKERRGKGSSSTVGDNTSLETEDSLQTAEQRGTALSVLLKGLSQAQHMIDGYTKLLPRILSREEGAREELEKVFQEAVDANPAFAEFLSPLGFEGGTLSATANWIELSEALVSNRNYVQKSVDELMAAPIAKKRVGRPFGSRKTKRNDPEGDDEAKSVAPAEKKRKTRTKAKTEGTEGQQAGRKPSAEENVKEPDGIAPDADGKTEESKSNKNPSIPLKRKCEIVEHAKRLLENESVYSVEKEMVKFFPQELGGGGDESSVKSGLLTKWIRTVSFSPAPKTFNPT